MNKFLALCLLAALVSAAP